VSNVKTGRSAIIEQFLADGIDHMFGNPGTVEQGFLDALADHPDMRYVLTLQETVAVMIGDGFARARHKTALVQIHSTPGLGNAIGALYQANRGHAPLVVIGGDAGLRYVPMEAQMYGDLVGMARPVTKWSTMVADPQSLLRTIRRAIKVASTPPMGPVYVCLPADVLDAPAVERVIPTSIPSTAVVPEPAWIERVAKLLAGARRPMILIGDGVAYSGAVAELARVAELLGAEVWGVDSGELNMSYAHPLYQGQTGHMFGAHSLPIVSRGDVVLIVGTYVVPEVFPELGDIFAPDAKVIHIDLNAYEIAKSHRVDLGVTADPRLTLDAVAAALEGTLTDRQRSAAETRAKEFGDAKTKAATAQRTTDEAAKDATPLRFATFASELARQAPSDLIVFDEALTSSPELTRYLVPTLPGQFFQTRGGSLGVGFPGAIGAQLANPGKTVIGVSGDGGAMYTIQSLWTAARDDLPVKFIVANNGSYRLLQLNVDEYWKEQGIAKHDYPMSFDLSNPPLHFVEMARGMGVQGIRVEHPWEIGPAVEQMLAHPGPFLVDLVLESDTHPERIGAAFGQ
jgi:thiamine pyrophosphate-dependent acetolactate synthase large subunit-like protein